MITKENLDKPDNDRSKINPILLKFFDDLRSELQLKNIDIRIFEGYRTAERQNYLKNVKKTTDLGAGKSLHNKLPSDAILINQYLKNSPVWGGYLEGTDFKKIVNNLLLKNSLIEWGGNFKKPLVYQFSVKIADKKTVNPPQVIVNPPRPAVINPPSKTIPSVSNPIAIPKIIPNTPTKLIPASVKVEVDNSTIIVGTLAFLAFLWVRK